MNVRPTSSFPLGARFDGIGTRFAVMAGPAERVELCLFDEDDRETRFALPAREGDVWSGYIPDLRPGQRYGYRVHGPYDPATTGQRCNPHKLLVDPYALAVDGQVDWQPAVFPYPFDQPGSAQLEDSAALVPKSVVVSPWFEWGADQAPRIPWSDTVVLELHVKAATMLHPEVPQNIRGTYAGLAHPAFIEHLQQLGVTAVELLPVHHFVHSKLLLERGLRNHWGYDSLAFFAPHAEYAAHGSRGEQVGEFKQMVKTLHAAGIEVWLDVVYNHTCEGNHLGPILSLKGFDNASYYRLVDEDRRYYMDYTGCGNTVDSRSPFALQLIVDSLRYWAGEMHVDGFRFDLATALGREQHGFDPLGGFLDVLQQDPLLRETKLVAEPWDVGEGGYQIGGFPAHWSEWNGPYRDDIRDFWRGEEGKLGAFAQRFMGSADIYETRRRWPRASINFITCHDGFTLRDLVSYDHKHNDANGEDNRDGEDHNRSWNCGAEGETDDPEVLALRARQQRNMLTTLILSQGVPMLLAGDAFGRTQRGNNNAYCQDNELSWIDWQNRDEGLSSFTEQLLALRRNHRVFRQARWVKGREGEAAAGVVWYRPDGKPMRPEDWTVHFARTLGVFLDGRGVRRDEGEPDPDSCFLILVNASHEDLSFGFPTDLGIESWMQRVDTSAQGREFRPRSMKRRKRVQLAARSIKLFSWDE